MEHMEKMVVIYVLNVAQQEHMQMIFLICVFQIVAQQEANSQMIQLIDVYNFVLKYLAFMLKIFHGLVSYPAKIIGIV